MKKIHFAFYGLLIISSLACKKEKGPQGETGPAGSTGIKSDQVFTFTTSVSSWTAVTWPYNYQETSFNIPSITSAVIAGGDVRVYLGDGTGTSWTALPSSLFTIQYNYTIKAGLVLVDVTLDNTTLPTNPGVQNYKVVVLPPARINKKNNSPIENSQY